VSDTSVKVTVDGVTLKASDLALIRNIDVSEAMYTQTQVSMVITCNVDNASNWSTPFDSLVAPFAKFQIEINRAGKSLVVPARATSASWSLQAGGPSTLTIAGLDASADLDREEIDKPWPAMSDGDIARQLLAQFNPKVGGTPPSDGSDRFTPHQRGTNWSFLKALAQRNQFDVYLTSEKAGVITGVFDRIDPTAAPQADHPLDLGYGSLGGTANVQVQLVTGQRVKFTYGIDGVKEQQVADNDGTGSAMGTRSLGGATIVLRDAKDLTGTQKPDVAARALAEPTAFGASLSVTLTAPGMPLLRARGTVIVRGLGSLLSGLWLVRSVRHTITQGGHVQALTLVRNALGDRGAGAGAVGVAGAVGGAVAGAL
jgi:phage protein D